MSDLFFIGVTLGFFWLAIRYAHGCEALRGGSHD
jgi:hypothetical protein